MSLTEPIRILFICHDGALYGAQQSLRLLVSHLPADQYCIWVSVARPGPLLPLLAELPHVQVCRHQRLAWCKSSPRSPIQRLMEGASLLAGAFWRLPSLIRLIQQHDIQLVHTNSLVSLEGALAAKVTRIPHIWHIREHLSQSGNGLFPLLGQAATIQLVHWLSCKVLCISQSVRQQFPATTEDPRYVLLPNAVAFPKERQSLSAQQSTETWLLGFVGSLTPAKGFDTLLHALCQLKAASWRLTVAGQWMSDTFKAECEALLQQRQLMERVDWLGFQTDMQAVWRKMDVLIVPSVHEAFGRVVIEAMAVWVPVIGAASGGITELITHEKTGWLFPPNQPNELARQICHVMSLPPEQRQSVAQQAETLACRHYGIHAQISRLQAVYHAALADQA